MEDSKKLKDSNAAKTTYMNSFCVPKKNVGMDLLSEGGKNGNYSIMKIMEKKWGLAGQDSHLAVNGSLLESSVVAPSVQTNSPVPVAVKENAEKEGPKKSILQMMKERNKTGVSFGSKR